MEWTFCIKCAKSIYICMEIRIFDRFKRPIHWCGMWRIPDSYEVDTLRISYYFLLVKKMHFFLWLPFLVIPWISYRRESQFPSSREFLGTGSCSRFIFYDSHLRRNDGTIKLYSYFLHDLTISLILDRDIFPIQKKSNDDKYDSKKSEPIVRRERERYTWSNLSRYFYEADTFTWDNFWCLSHWGWKSNIINKKEGSEKHKSSESHNRIFPDFLAENTWIKNPTHKTNKRKYIESIFDLSRKSEIHSRHIPSEIYDSKKNEGENNTNNTNCFIRRFLCELGDKFHHIYKVGNRRLEIEVLRVLLFRG